MEERNERNNPPGVILVSDPQAVGKRFTFCKIAQHQSDCELQLPVVTDWLIQ